MGIGMQQFSIKEDASVRVEVDYNFLSTGWVRRVYKVKPNMPLQIPITPHAHDGEQVIILLEGSGRLAYEDEDESIKVISLTPNSYYSIPPFVPHQIELVGGIMEVFFPVASARNPNIVVGAESFFKG
ncbi:MAG: hypothetical protein DDT19_01213 [Syntrophomonadaceae bacterium]|nr:hypothetical protein [Bacillota bacterium]